MRDASGEKAWVAWNYNHDLVTKASTTFKPAYFRRSPEKHIQHEASMTEGNIQVNLAIAPNATGILVKILLVRL